MTRALRLRQTPFAERLLAFRAERAKRLRALRKMWAEHDRLERAIIREERWFTDRELDELLERGT